jgi:hypothetical protein
LTYYNRQHPPAKWAVFVVLAAVLVYDAALANSDNDKTKLEVCHRDAEGRFVMSPIQEQTSKLHAFAFLANFPLNKEGFDDLNKFVTTLKKGLEGNGNALNPRFALGVTHVYPTCKSDPDACRNDFVSGLRWETGEGQMLTATATDMGKRPKEEWFNQGYSEKVMKSVNNKERVFLDADVVYKLLNQLYRKAENYYKDHARLGFRCKMTGYSCRV